MRYRITFVAGLAVGYVLGTKAGRTRYEQIVRATQRVAGSPTARQAANRVSAGFSAVGERVGEHLPLTSVRDFLRRPTAEEEAEVVATSAANGASGTPGAGPYR
ncbi:hypothetical protein J4H86_07485 [Spiractinospora alimapuensis]|uniref:hypothetical protein n=1 Tax=Spiractinospora alimapuensis TaxID=2820884 RepID=UPI001F3E0DF0|nr:hypothetical protein [Spiractinospora alimapuensis]QVQ53575.1 hypothetical protein J4H86_07485 [Spiractinospora alimapuensis]